MKSLFSAILALGFLAGAANAAPVAQIQAETVIEYSCGYGYGR